MIPIWIVIAYLFILLVLGGAASRLFRGTSQDYMLASHSIGPFLLLMSLFGTTMTAFALVGSTGEAYTEGVGVYGLLASSSGIIHSLCFFLIGLRVWGFARRYGYRTQIQFFRDRLESDKFGLLLFPILVGLVIPYLLIGVIASGSVISAVTEGAFTDSFAQYDYGIPPWLGSLVISIVVLIYVFFGGMRGTAWANAFQTMVFMVLGVVTFVIIANRLGESQPGYDAQASPGGPIAGAIHGMKSLSERVLNENPTKLKRDVDQQDRTQYEQEYERWEALAEYDFATRRLERKVLTSEQQTAAHAAFKPRMPGWERVAEALYARDHELIELSIPERNRARVLQDDRVLPDPMPDDREGLWQSELLRPSREAVEHQESSRPFLERVWVAIKSLWSPRPYTHTLSEFPRIENIAETRSLALFGPDGSNRIGHPNAPLDADDPDGERKWTRKRAAGIYRATHWAPEEPHGMDPWEFLTYMFIPFSVGMFPHLFQHWLTAKSANSFKLPVVAHPIFIMLTWVPCIMLGLWATSAMWEGRALIPPHFPPNAILGAMVQRLTGPVLTGFLTAGILAAIMSSLDSQFLCVGSIFTNDFVTHYARKDRFSDKQVVLMARLFVVGIVAVTYFFSLFEHRRVFVLGIWTFSGFASLFPLVFAAVYWRRLTKLGAYAGVLTTIGLWLWFFSESNYGSDTKYTVFGLQPVATMFVASAVAMVLVSLVTPPPSDATIAKFFPPKRK
ncbi:MAG: sodium:solute symporter family protein [Planctomycetaceae bacterium]